MAYGTTGDDTTQETQQTQQQGQTQETQQDDTSGTSNPVVEVGMAATLEDGWYFASPQMEYLLPDLNNPYVGLYHLMRDGTYMVGEGVLNASHEINPNGIIIQYFQSTTDLADVEDDIEMPVVDYETIQEVREIVSDLFYKKWFVEHTLTDEQVLSLQTTIRGGIKQTAGKDGRSEGEPLVFYKKDRNTLENRQDLQGDVFESICQDIFDNEIPNDIIPEKFTIYEPDELDWINLNEPAVGTQYWRLQEYIMQYTSNNDTKYNVLIANEAILYEEYELDPNDTDTSESN